MSFAVVVALCFLEAQTGAPNPPQPVESDAMAQQAESLARSHAASPAPDSRAVYEEQQFVKKFNRLLNAMREFADQYNHHAVDLKKVKALKKAWHDLEKTDGWMRLDEASGQ